MILQADLVDQYDSQTSAYPRPRCKSAGQASVANASSTPNGRDEQIAILDSQLRWTLSRFCSIAWFGYALQLQQALRQPPALEPNPSCWLHLLKWLVHAD